MYIQYEDFANDQLVWLVTWEINYNLEIDNGQKTNLVTIIVVLSISTIAGRQSWGVPTLSFLVVTKIVVVIVVHVKVWGLCSTNTKIVFAIGISGMKNFHFKIILIMVALNKVSVSEKSI